MAKKKMKARYQPPRYEGPFTVVALPFPQPSAKHSKNERRWRAFAIRYQDTVNVFHKTHGGISVLRTDHALVITAQSKQPAQPAPETHPGSTQMAVIDPTAFMKRMHLEETSERIFAKLSVLGTAGEDVFESVVRSEVRSMSAEELSQYRESLQQEVQEHALHGAECEGRRWSPRILAVVEKLLGQALS